MNDFYRQQNELLKEIDQLRKEINSAEFNAVTFADKVMLAIMREEMAGLKFQLRELNNQIG